MVKPRLEVIHKNKNSIIVKVHDRNSPVFQSLEPRFKSLKSVDSMTSSQILSHDNSDSIHDLKKAKSPRHPKPPQPWRNEDSIPSIQNYLVEVNKDKNNIPSRPRYNRGSEWSKYRESRS